MIRLWKHLRIPVLAMTFSGTILVLGKSLVLPMPEQREPEPFAFPEVVSLSGWSLIDSQPISDIPGMKYRFYRQEGELSVEMNYVDQPHPNEKEFRKYSPNLIVAGDSTPIMRHQEAVGFYSLSVERQRAYLRSCINPRGESTITYEQFIRNRYTADLQPSRILPFLMGEEPLRDHRCLWTHLSFPIGNTSHEAAYHILEEAFKDWYQWWQPRFPKR